MEQSSGNDNNDTNNNGHKFIGTDPHEPMDAPDPAKQPPRGIRVVAAGSRRSSDKSQTSSNGADVGSLLADTDSLAESQPDAGTGKVSAGNSGFVTRTIPERVRHHSGGCLVQPETRLETTFKPSGEIVQFDVNRFLKKTLSHNSIPDDHSPDGDELMPSTHWNTEDETDPHCDFATSHQKASKTNCTCCGEVVRLSINGPYCGNCVQQLQSSPDMGRRRRQAQPGELNVSHISNPDEVTALLPTTTRTPVVVPDDIEPAQTTKLSSLMKYKGSTVDVGRYPAIVDMPAHSSNQGRLSLTPSMTSQSSASRPVCRICQLPGEPNDALMSPCRCSGTMQYVHKSCLVHWLEISTRKMCPSPRCELCGYQYKTHHCLKVQRLHMPDCGHRDKALHLVFVLMILVMLGCAALSIVFLQAGSGDGNQTVLDGDDITVITCSILFFLSFFVAVFTQYRAEATLCTLCFRCWLINKHWRIRNYDPGHDKSQWIVTTDEPE